jgi:hypothetical protein
MDKKEYQKQYRARHRDKLAEYSKRYYAENKDKFAKLNKQYREEHKEELAAKAKEYNKHYYVENREQVLERSNKWKAEHKEELKVKSREYYLKHYEDTLKWNVEHRKKKAEIAKRYRETLNKRVEEISPNICFFNDEHACRSRKGWKLDLHEKSGNGHNKWAVRIILDDTSKANDFVRLCSKHHDMVHALMELGRTWDEIETFINIC